MGGFNGRCGTLLTQWHKQNYFGKIEWTEDACSGFSESQTNSIALTKECCTDGQTICSGSNNSPKLPSSVCKNPSQYNGAAMLNTYTCDRLIAKQDSIYSAFAARNCAGMPGNLRGLMRLVGGACCADRWDTCSEEKPEPAATICKNPSEYDGGKTPRVFHGFMGMTCDQIVSLHGTNSAFRKRTCDPSAGMHGQFLGECDPDLDENCKGVAFSLNYFGHSCCKDSQSVCWQGNLESSRFAKTQNYSMPRR